MAVAAMSSNTISAISYVTSRLKPGDGARDGAAESEV
jgi:hypothetical protein